jgi:hypothetical protein
MFNVNSKIIYAFLITIFSIVNANAQTSLNGSWEVSCVIEKTDKASISFCDLCSYSMNDKKTELNFELINMNFSKDSLEITIDKVSTKVYCKTNENAQLIEFTFKGKEYKFRILTISEFRPGLMYIIKDEKGALLFLGKKL